MEENVRIIKVSEYSLDAFATYDNDFYDITLLPLAATNNVIIKSNADRRFTLDDMAQVLEKVVINRTDAAIFFFTWFDPLILHFYDALKLNELFGDNPASIDAFRLTMMPQTDDDLLRWILAHILRLFREMSLVKVHLPVSEYIGAEELLRMIDLQNEESMLPVDERHYISELKDDFIHELDNDLILKEVDRFTKKLFIKYVNELCEENNFNALRIKGFACLGGNSVFKCDYKEAARCMEILWREGSFGYAANTLGFMCLEGRLTEGRPDFGQAFKYFSIGHSFGISESTFKLAEMYMEGVYVAKNLEMAATLIERVYIDSRVRFEQEDFEGSFAEAAMNMGRLQYKIYKENPDNFEFMKEQALDFYLQAQFALFLRSQFGMSHGDRKLKETVENTIGELTAGMKIYKSSFKVEAPGPLRDFMTYRPYGIYSMDLKLLKNNKVKITVNRLANRVENMPALTLLTYREFCCCSLTDNITFTANKAELSGCDQLTDIVFDDISIDSAPGGITTVKFFYGRKEIITVKAEGFTISRP